MRPALAVIFVALTLVSCRGTRTEEPAPPAGTQPSRQQTSQRVLPRNQPLASYSEVVDRVTPAVVTIYAERRVRQPRQFPFMLDPFFREFFGNRQPQGSAPRRAAGLGSGVIVSNDGYTLTNHHVIDGAENITVELPDRRRLEARLVGSDPLSDLAVLQLRSRDMAVLPLGNSDDVRVGDVVLAVGNPFGLGQSVTAGIISAKGRSTGISDGSFQDFLQTDAPINRGNSGGALVNTNGELIGINSQIYTPSGANAGIGFAIPSNMAKLVWDQLVSDGKVRRGALGITIQNALTDEDLKRLGLRDARGVLVNSVASGGPADRAGIKAGDLIVALNGEQINDSNHLRVRIASTRPGSDMTVRILRGGSERDVRVSLGELQMPDRPQQEEEEP